MKPVFIFLIVVLSIYSGQAQTGEDSIKAAVNRLFEGMKSADANIIRQAFADSAVLQTIVQDKEGKITIRNEAVGDFADFVGKLSAGDADERIRFETIKSDGTLATVWAPYNFYFKGKFSHCGIDAFQLVKINGDWKIQYIIDTRRREGCAL